jgi:two-component system LytT family response regulator
VEVIAECEHATEALAKTSALKPNLVFLDVAMPGKNGIDFLRDLDEIPFEVIFVTAHDKYILQAIRFAAVDYLQKPVEEQQLITAVSNAAKRYIKNLPTSKWKPFCIICASKAGKKKCRFVFPVSRVFRWWK